MLKYNGAINHDLLAPRALPPRFVNDNNGATISDLVCHIIYPGQRIGYDHVGLGDGMLNGPKKVGPSVGLPGADGHAPGPGCVRARGQTGGRVEFSSNVAGGGGCLGTFEGDKNKDGGWEPEW